MIYSARLPKIYQEARRVLKLTLARHDVPDYAPADLKDTNVKIRPMEDGSDPMALLTTADFARGADNPMRPTVLLMLSTAITLLSVLVASITQSFFTVFFVVSSVLGLIAWAIFEEDGKTAAAMSILSLPTCLVYPIYIMWMETRPMASPRSGYISRAQGLYVQATNNHQMREFSGYYFHSRKVRRQQAEFAAKDKTPFIAVGQTTGTLDNHDDPYAPDAGKDFGLTVNDLSTHLAIMGSTGTGKTVAIRKIAKQYCEKTDGGMVVFCGKGTLPADLKGIDPEYKLINPEETALSLFAGMKPMEVVDALTPAQSGDAFFHNASRVMLKNATVVLYYMSQTGNTAYKFTALNLVKMLNANGGKGVAHADYRLTALQEACELRDENGIKLCDKGGLLSAAIEYFAREFPLLKETEETFAGVLSGVNQWLEPLFTDELIAKWANTDEGFDITTVCKGARIGVDVPVTKYGEAASRIVSNLLRQRLYGALKARGELKKAAEGQKEVLIVMDEAHLLWQPDSGNGNSDNDMVSIGRSLGGLFIIGTQSVDELEARMGSDRTLATLGNFRNFMAYASTEKTLSYMSGKAGEILRPVQNIYNEQNEATGVNVFNEFYTESISTLTNHHGFLGTPAAKFADSARKLNPLRLIIPGRGETIGDDGKMSIQASTNTGKDHGRAVYPTMTPGELKIATSERFAAIAVFNRAGIPRRDVIIVSPES